MTCYLNENGVHYLDQMIQYNIKPEWFDDEFIKEAMLEIEHVYKIEGLAFYSSDHGVKSPQSLSNGMKALLLLKYLPEDCWYYEQGTHISDSSIGDNVVPFLRRLSLTNDFPIAWDEWIPFEVDEPLRGKDSETGTIFNTTTELDDFYCGRCGIWDI